MATARVRDVKVMVGHISQNLREYTVPSNTIVSVLLDKVGLTIEDGESVIDSRANPVNMDDKVKDGEEYTVSGNLKAR